MNDADDYARLMAAFDELEDAKPADRAAALAAVRAKDAALARSLEALWAETIRDETVLDREIVISGPWAAADPREETEDEPPLPLAVGEVLDDFRLTEVIGRGGMGCVYRAVHVRLGRIVAIKVLDPRLTEDGQYVSRFLHEAKLVSALRHPNIVEVFDFIQLEAPRRVAFVMAFLRGETLGQVLTERALHLEEVRVAGLQLCDALEAVHGEGVVHRDLKPDNIIVVGPLTPSTAEARELEPAIKLLDFGIAKVPDPLAMHQTATGTLMGTPTYMAPEQFAAEAPSPATDVYALGEILCEMITQCPVFPGRGLALMRRKLNAGRPELELPSEVPPSLVRILQNCLHTDPSARPSLESVRAALLRLEPSSSTPDLPVMPPPGPPPAAGTPPPSERPRRRWSLVAALGAMVTVGAVWAAFSKPEPRDEAVAPPPAREVQVPRAELPAIVYGEPEARNTPYALSGSMGDLEALQVDPAWTVDPRSGPTCLRITYGPDTGWAGHAWLDPPGDWGDRPGGLDLRGAQRLSFWARADREGIELKVGYGLLLRDRAFFDSTRQQQVITLTRSWTRYTFDLRNKNLAQIKSGFYFSMDSPGPGGPHHFYFDDIQYE